ncbi:hypothetical protein EJB05_46141, partial [Eragrostis curvula]
MKTMPEAGADRTARPQPLHCVKCLCYGDHGKDIDCSADVVLRGYSGCNTRWAARVLERAVASIPRPVRAVTVFFGANDAALRDRASKLQHLRTQPHFLIGLTSRDPAACALFQNRWPSVVVILITPPPVDEDGRLRYPYAHDSSGLPERTNAAAGRYARACVDVARRCGVRAIDIWSRMQKFPGWEKTFLRSHLTPSGSRVLFEEVVFAGPVRAVTVFFGANDAAQSDRDSSRRSNIF